MDKEKVIATAAEPEAKQETGKTPAAEKKPAAARARKESKPKESKPKESKSKADSLKPVVVLQFQGAEVDLDTLVEAAKADFRQAKKRTPITELKLYVKPEERMAYYVVNEKHNGSIAY